MRRSHRCRGRACGRIPCRYTEGLEVAVRGAIAQLRAEWVVVHRLKDCPVHGAVGPYHLAYVAEVVAVIIVEEEVVLHWVAGIFRCLAAALVELEFVDAPVPQCEAAAEEVVRGVSAQNLRLGELPRAADGDTDVGHRRQVCGAQLLTHGTVDVLRHAAVGELYPHGVVQPVVVYPRYPAPGIARERARGVVPLLLADAADLGSYRCKHSRHTVAGDVSLQQVSFFSSY